jgi:hypothetical protein
MCKSANPYNRANAAEILGQWVRFKKPPAGPRRAAVVAALNAALDDPFPDVPPGVACVLGLSKDGELCGVLKNAAERRRALGNPKDVITREYLRCTAK